MEGVAVNLYRNLKGMCSRRGYKRLTVSTRHRRSTTPEHLGSSSADPHRRRRRRFWRIRISPRLRLLSPKKFLIGLRDAYVNFMLRLASSPAVAGAGGGYGGVAYGGAGFGVRPVKEYDEKVIIEIYKSLVKAHGQLVVREAGGNDSNVICAPRS